MMRSHGWDRDLPSWKQKQLRDKYKCSVFESLYNFYVPGMNLRSTDLQAFIGISAIDKLDSYSDKRRNNFFKYIENIKINNLTLKERDGDFVSSFALPIVNKNRDLIISALEKNDIEVRPLIAGNMANKPMWEKEETDLPNCDLVERCGFYIPNHQDLTKENIITISNIINTNG